MSWEQPTFSFEQRQPPTPTRTPTSPSFADFFHTPKFDSSFYDSRAGWNPADLGSASPSSSKTPKPPSFGHDSFGKNSSGKNSLGKEAGSMTGRMLGAEFAANKRNILATPDFSSLQFEQPEHLAGHNSTTRAPVESATPTQLGLSLETDFGTRSARSMQTPPPTSVSASKRQGQQRATQSSPGNGSRRMSAPSAPPPNVTESTPKASRGRAVQVDESPAHLGSLEFSPDVFGPNFGIPATAPAYPQQKLFWEPEQGDNMDTSFANISDPFVGPRVTEMDPFAPKLPALSTSQAGPSSMVDLSHNDMVTSSFAQSSFVSTAHHSGASASRPQTGVDPTLLFSSPSRLPVLPPGSDPAHPRVLNEDSLQPYAYQLQEAKRDKVYAGVVKPRRRRKPSVDSPAVKAALENLREDPDDRPHIRRSFTESALPRMNRDFAQGPPRPDSRHGRSSPLKRIQETKKERDKKARHRTSIALTIDANGRARAETRAFGRKAGLDSNNENAMDVDGSSGKGDDSTTDEDESGDVVMTSFSRPGTSGPKMGRFSNNSSAMHSHKTSTASMASSRGPLDNASLLPQMRPATAGPQGANRMFGLPPLQTATVSRRPLVVSSSPTESGDDDSEAETVISATDSGPHHNAANDHAQSELRKVLRASTSGPPPGYNLHHPSFLAHGPLSRGVGASFVPPPSARDHGLSKLSPTTVTDPDLATPGGSAVRPGPGNVSTGGSSASGDGAVRCVCRDVRDDGGQMIQCESCSKWLHVRCIGLNPQRLPAVYLCLLCTGQTPAVRGGRVRDPAALAGAGARKSGFEIGIGIGDGEAAVALESPLAGKVGRGR